MKLEPRKPMTDFHACLFVLVSFTLSVALVIDFHSILVGASIPKVVKVPQTNILDLAPYWRHYAYTLDLKGKDKIIKPREERTKFTVRRYCPYQANKPKVTPYTESSNTSCPKDSCRKRVCVSTRASNNFSRAWYTEHFDDYDKCSPRFLFTPSFFTYTIHTTPK